MKRILPLLLLPALAHGASVLRFDSPDDVVDTGAPVQLSGAFAVAAWYRADHRSGDTGFGHIAGQGNNMSAAAGGFGVYTDVDWPVMQVNHGRSAVEWTFDGASSETWRLVVARFDENASPDPICDLWVHGVWKNYWQRDNSSGRPWDIPEGWATSAEPFLMGRSIGYNGATNAFRGCIAEVSVWNRMLTTAEVQAMAAHRALRRSPVRRPGARHPRHGDHREIAPRRATTSDGRMTKRTPPTKRRLPPPT